MTLRENKAVTLMNTADGTRYKLILKPVGTAVPTAAADVDHVDDRDSPAASLALSRHEGRSVSLAKPA